MQNETLEEIFTEWDRREARRIRASEEQELHNEIQQLQEENSYLEEYQYEGYEKWEESRQFSRKVIDDMVDCMDRVAELEEAIKRLKEHINSAKNNARLAEIDF